MQLAKRQIIKPSATQQARLIQELAGSMTRRIARILSGWPARGALHSTVDDHLSCAGA